MVTVLPTRVVKHSDEEGLTGCFPSLYLDPDEVGGSRGLIMSWRGNLARRYRVPHASLAILGGIRAGRFNP